MNQILEEMNDFMKDKLSIGFAFDDSLLVPEFSNAVPTAAVMFEKTDEAACIKLIFNEDFWNSLNLYERQFVFAHEVMHVMLDHGRRGFIYLKTLPKHLSSHKLVNIAQDICMNEILFSEYFVHVPKSSFPIIAPMVCTIKNCFGDKADEILTRQNFQYYYEKLLEGIEKNDGENGERINFPGGTGGLADDLEYSEETPTLDEIIEAISDGFMETPEEMEKGETKQSNGYGIGGSATGGKTETEKPKVASLEECLKDVIGRSTKSIHVKPKTNWYSVNRRTSSLGFSKQGIYVPHYTYDKPIYKPSILIYSDVSGSVSNYSKKFFGLIEALDETKYDIEVYPWASYVGSLKMKFGHVSWVNCGYGTNIMAVLSHFKQLKKEYDAVIVLTDGEYNNISNMSNFEKWNFFFTHGSSYSLNAPKDAKRFILK